MSWSLCNIEVETPMKLCMELKTRMTLEADTAADVMAPNPVSLRAEATVREALALLTGHNFSAAPGWTDIALPLNRIRSGPRERQLDLNAVTALRVFYQGTPTAGETFFVDAVSLHGSDAGVALHTRTP